MNPLFEGIIVNNIKDLANFNIMTLHEKLNKSNKVYVKNNNLINKLFPLKKFSLQKLKKNIKQIIPT